MSRNVPFQRGNSKDFTLSCNETLWRMKYKSICCIQISFQRLRNICRKKRSSVILLTIQCPSWKRMLHHRGKWQKADLFHFSCPPHLSTNKCVYWETNPWDWKTLASKKNLIYQEVFLVVLRYILVFQNIENDPVYNSFLLRQNPISSGKHFGHLCFITNPQILKTENWISFKVLRFQQKLDFVVYSILTGIPPFPSATFCQRSLGSPWNTSSHNSFTMFKYRETQFHRNTKINKLQIHTKYKNIQNTNFKVLPLARACWGLRETLHHATHSQCPNTEKHNFIEIQIYTKYKYKENTNTYKK